MKYRALFIIIALVVVGSLWFFVPRGPKVVARSATTLPFDSAHDIPASQSPASAETESQVETAEEPATPTPGEAVLTAPKTASLATLAELPEGPESGPGLTPFTVLENMRTVFRQYSQRFGGNPVGNNREITSALNGANPGHAILVNPEDGMQINGGGELVDNWGTPFFFHQLSRTEMEIRSAGPDRKLWNSDDLVLK